MKPYVRETRFALNQDNAPAQKAISIRHCLADEGNIKMDYEEVEGGGGMERIDLVQDKDRSRALANAVMNLRVP